MGINPGGPHSDYSIGHGCYRRTKFNPAILAP